MRLQEVVEKLLRQCSDTAEHIDGGIRIGHQPYRGLFAYFHRFYAPLLPNEIAALEDHVGIAVPEAYRNFLLESNGAHMFGGAVSLRGHVAQMSRTISGLGQPISLRYGNVRERPHDLAEDDFVFGGIVGYDKKIELVMTAMGQVRAVNSERGNVVYAAWSDFDSFLDEELRRLSKLFDASGKPLVPLNDLIQFNVTRH